MRKTFGEYLRLTLQIRGMTQRSLAEKIGVGQPQIGRYLSGIDFPTVPRLIGICDALGVTPNVLLGFQGDERDRII